MKTVRRSRVTFLRVTKLVINFHDCGDNQRGLRISKLENVLTTEETVVVGVTVVVLVLELGVTVVVGVMVLVLVLRVGVTVVVGVIVLVLVLALVLITLLDVVRVTVVVLAGVGKTLIVSSPIVTYVQPYKQY